MQNKMENHPVALLFRWNHRYSIINLNFNEKQSKTTPFYFTHIYCFLFPPKLVPCVWPLGYGGEECAARYQYTAWQTTMFLRILNLKVCQRCNRERTGGKNYVHCCFIPLQNNKTDILSGRAYFWVLAEIISCLIISSRFTIFKAEFCHPAGNFYSIRQI